LAANRPYLRALFRAMRSIIAGNDIHSIEIARLPADDHSETKKKSWQWEGQTG